MPDVFDVTCTGAAGLSGGSPAIKTIGTLIASTSIRGFLEEFSVGVSSTPADQALQWILQRFTAAGTAGSSVTPAARGGSDVPASLISAGQAHSAEPTYTSAKELWQSGINTRASAIGVACRPGREYIIPATSANGIGMQAGSSSASSAPTCEVAMSFHQ
jgi:hypothetical protein